LFLVVLAVTASAFAQVDVSSDSANFGQVNQGESVSVKFQIRNSGTKPLTITGLEFSMPDMNARVKQEIDAGSSAEILINWDTSRLRGEVKGQAVLTINDPQTPESPWKSRSFHRNSSKTRCLYQSIQW